MNLSKCRRCGADVKIVPHATNKRFCSKDCYDTWWNEHRSKNKTRGELAELMFGPRPTVGLTDVQAAWLGALIDGEGCIGVWRERRVGNTSGWSYRAVIQIVNSNRALIEQALAFVDGFAHWKNIKRDKPHHKPTYGVTVSRRAVQQVLEQVMPFLVAKRKQATLVIEFCKLLATAPVRASQDHDVFEQYYQECKKLNRRGISKGD